jgi:hypothetical protein
LALQKQSHLICEAVSVEMPETVQRLWQRLRRLAGLTPDALNTDALKTDALDAGAPKTDAPEA